MTESNTIPPEEAMFQMALEMPATDRAAYLALVCPDDVMRQRIEGLIAAYEAEPGFMSAPITNAGAETLILGGRPVDGDRIDCYKLLQQIGEGGFGVVWMAEQEEPVRRKVALKIIKPGMDTREVIARFEQERQALAMMDHPNIAKVLDAGATATGRPYFVMELVRGTPITRYCDGACLSTEERLKLFVQVCQAVQHAHQKGIIHRDLKPSNILVSLHDGVPVPKVIDFGIAKAVEQRLTDRTLFTQYEQMVGTPAYMSPEQAEMSGLDVDTRSDIYTLGVLLYELLTGRAPFDPRELMKKGLDEMRRVIREEEPPRPSTAVSTMTDEVRSGIAKSRHSESPKLAGLLRGDLDWIVMKALEKDRNRRYATANGLGDDIRRHLNNEPVAASPPGAAYRVSKFVRRHRVMVASVTGIVLAMLIGLAGTLYMYSRERLAREESDQSNQIAMMEAARATKSAALARQAAQEAQLGAYTSDMKAAQIALNETNAGRAVELLGRHIPHAGQPDLRAVEWRWLWMTAAGQSHTSYVLPRIVPSMALSPDAKFLVTACFDGWVRIWDTTQRRLFREIVWVEPQTGDIRQPQQLAFTPDGTRLAMQVNGMVEILSTKNWSVETGVPGTGPLAFSKDGTQLALRRGSSLVLWHTEKRSTRTIGDAFPGPDTHVAWSGDSRQIYTSARNTGASSAVLGWEVETGKQTRKYTGLGSIVAIDVSPDGKWLVGGSTGGVASLWETATGRQLPRFNAHSSWLLGMAFSPDGSRLATGGSDQLVKVWDTASLVTATEQAPTVSLAGHRNEIWQIAWSADGEILATAGKDSTARIWRVPSKNMDASPHVSLPAGAASLDFAPDGQHFRAFAAPGTLLWYGTADCQLKRSQSLPEPTVRTPIPLLNGNMVYSTTDGGLRWYDPEKNKITHFLQTGVAGIVPLRVSADEKKVLVLEDTVLRVLDAATGRELVRREDFKGARGREHKYASLSPDGRYLAYAAPGYTVAVWDIENKRLHRVLEGLGWSVYAVTFSPDGTRIAAGGWDGQLLVWDAESGNLALPPIRAHLGGVNSVHFSATGDTLLTMGDGDRIMRLWSAANGRELCGHPDLVTSVHAVFSPEGKFLAIGERSDSDHVRLLTLPTVDEIDRATGTAEVKVPEITDQTQLLLRKGDFLARRGQVGPTREVYEALAKIGPPTLDSCRRTLSLAAMDGDGAAWKHHVLQAMPLLKNSQDVAGVANVLRAVLILPDSPIPAAEVEALLDQAIATPTGKNNVMLAFVRGLSQYRAGKLQESLVTLRAYLARRPHRELEIMCRALIALAESRTGQLTMPAADMLRELETEKNRLPAPGRQDLSRAWWEVMDTHVLINEAITELRQFAN